MSAGGTGGGQGIGGAVYIIELGDQLPKVADLLLPIMVAGGFLAGFGHRPQGGLSLGDAGGAGAGHHRYTIGSVPLQGQLHCRGDLTQGGQGQLEVTTRSEEHTSELQSRGHLVCRLLLETTTKKKI